MPEFLPIRLEQRDQFDALIRARDSRSADYNFNNLYLWQQTYGVTAAIIEGCLVLRYDFDGTPKFTFPIGDGDVKTALEVVLAHCRSEGIQPRICGLTADMVDELAALYPDSFTLIHDRDYDDYLYTVEKLANLAGKKLHGKRNHINKFVQEHTDWSYEPITADNMAECRAMDDEWLQLNAAERHANYDDEARALDMMFTHYEEMGLEGGLLRVDGKVVAFTVGEQLSSDTWNTHFEKAFSHIQGAYPMINREYARYIAQKHPHIVYINREDDMGLENLRKAKESYYPDLMVEKFTADFNR